VTKDSVTGHEGCEEHMASCSRETSMEATGGGHRLRYNKKFEFEQSRTLIPLCCAVNQAVGLCYGSRYGFTTID
jgi:hypothetical protein